MASAPSFPSWLSREERLVDRAPAVVAAVIGGHAAEVTDASALGCRVRTDAPGGVGAFLTLSAGGVGAAGWVAWRRGDTLGLDFAQPLTPEQLAALTGGPSA